MTNLTRRHVLRGILGGGAVTVGLPLLNCFLNTNGTALASGEVLPTRFGTWLWGLGMNKQIFTPKTFGANFELPPEIDSLKNVKQHINLFSNFNTFRDASPLMCHHTGWVILRSGIAPTPANPRPGESIDVTVAKRIGNTTRFQILSATATGDVRDSYSYENTNSINPPEWSPVRFYQKLFGPDYQDPNAAEFVPNPKVMIRKSVLSGVLDETKSFQQKIGAEDRARLDQYFTGLRDLERQFDMQLAKPKPLAACKHIDAPTADPPAGLDAGLVSKRHRMMTDIMVMALACDQTRVFNMGYAAETASTSKPGYEKPHHTATHEEPEGPGGYQEEVSWFTRRAMEEWAYFVEAFAKTPEGDGTLLDHTLAYALSDISYARIHSLDGIPMFTAGKAGGKLKTGLHIDGASSPGTRVGYTAMKVLGLDVPQWGTLSNQTSKDIGDVLV